MPDRTCSVDDCGRAVRARGWCELHYRRWRKTGDVADPRTTRVRLADSQCTETDCDRPYLARGLCVLHYSRMRWADPAVRKRTLAANRARYADDPAYREKTTAAAKQYREQRLDQVRQRDRNRSAKTLVVRAKVHIGECLRCGYDAWVGALQWAHVDASTKLAEPASLRRVSDAKAFEELRKCVLICANCHWEEGAGLWKPDQAMHNRTIRLLCEVMLIPA